MSRNKMLAAIRSGNVHAIIYPVDTERVRCWGRDGKFLPGGFREAILQRRDEVREMLKRSDTQLCLDPLTHAAYHQEHDGYTSCLACDIERRKAADLIDNMEEANKDAWADREKMPAYERLVVEY